MVIIAKDYFVHEECFSCSRNITKSPNLLDFFGMWFYMFNVEKTKAPFWLWLSDNKEFSICTTDGFCDGKHGKTSNVASSPRRLSGPLHVVELGWPTDDRVDAYAHDSKCQFKRPRFVRRANRKLHNMSHGMNGHTFRTALKRQNVYPTESL